MDTTSSGCTIIGSTDKPNSLKAPTRVDVRGATTTLHAYFLKRDEMWLCEDDIGSRIMRALSFGGSNVSANVSIRTRGMRLRRGCAC